MSITKAVNNSSSVVSDDGLYGCLELSEHNERDGQKCLREQMLALKTRIYGISTGGYRSPAGRIRQSAFKEPTLGS